MTNDEKNLLADAIGTLIVVGFIVLLAILGFCM